MNARAPAWSFAALLLASCASPIVGAECRAGWLECNGLCVEVQSDEHNCGVCGHECGPFECTGGTCGPLRVHDEDAGMSVPDAGADASTVPGMNMGGVGSPFSPDSGLSGCAIGETECASGCTDTLHDHDHCGDCDTACSEDAFCVDGICDPDCNAPLHLCNHRCVDFSNDAYNCGSCRHTCRSGICTSGVCSDVIPGSLIVIGHNFTSATPAMQIIAGNAALLPQGAPVRVLVYRGSARRAEYNGVIAAIDANGKQWKRVNVTVDRVVPELATAGTLVILPQDMTRDSVLNSIGRRWALAIAQFLYRGGVVVLFDGASNTNTGTYHLLEPSGVFSAAKREAIPAQTLTVKTPGFDIAVNAPTTYRSAGETVHFLDVHTEGTVVVADGAGEAVVIHRVISP
jgi:hypothetical protein